MANLYLFFDGGTIPSGWTLVSDSGQAFYQRFPRGNSTYGNTGGSTSHNHTWSHTTGGGSYLNEGYYEVAPADHVHTVSVSSTSANHLPPYLNLKVIRYTGVPSTLPAGVIAMFDDSPPSGWNSYTSIEGRFPRGAASAGGTGGTSTHSHSVSGTLETYSPPAGARGGGGGSSEYSGEHSHNVNDDSDSKSHLPPYIEVIFAKSSASCSIPNGLIGMFDGTPPTGWTVLSNSGGPFYQRFPRGATSYGATGGTTTHYHYATSDAASNTTTYTLRAGPEAPFHESTHYHWLKSNSVSHLPPYIDVIFAKYTLSPPDAPSNCTASYVSDSQIDITWTDNSDNEDGFKIERSVDGGAFTQIATVGANVTSYSDTTTSAGHKYEYRVCAYNAAGDSAYSLSNAIWTSPTPPTDLLCEGLTNPTDVTDTTPEFSAIGHGGAGDTLTHAWIQVDDDSAFGSPIWDSGWIDITDFTVENRCQNISYGGSALTRGKKYYWRIRFKNAQGRTGQWSTESAYFILRLLPPSNLQVTDVQADSVTIQFDAADGAEKYRMYRRVKGETTWTFVEEIPA